MTVDGKLYDKIINVTFFSNNINIPKKQLITQPFGFKPKININGMIIANSFFCNIELRIGNAFIDFDFAPYQSVSIDAGYSGDLFYSGISGTIFQAYIESPGPDGITVFMVKTTYQGIMETRLDFEFEGPGTFKQVIDKFVSDMNTELRINGYLFEYTVFIPTKLGETRQETNINVSGSMSNILVKIVEEYFQGFWSVNGSSITIFNKHYSANKKLYEITRVTSTPRSTVDNHISFTSPWIPSMMPGDSIHIDPKYLKASFGTYQALKNRGDSSEEKLNYTPGYYSVYSISFEFDTVESINTMIVDGLRDLNVDVNTGKYSLPTSSTKIIGHL